MLHQRESGAKRAPGTFRHLQRRSLVENVVPSYRADEAYTGPRIPKYVLTEEGKKHLTP